MEIQTGTIAGPRLSQVNFGLLAALTPTDIVAARVTASTNYVEASVREPNTNGKSRHPVYLPHGPSVRIVSRPCGAWRVERRVGEEELARSIAGSPFRTTHRRTRPFNECSASRSCRSKRGLK
jgi:hypothetical protein